MEPTFNTVIEKHPSDVVDLTNTLDVPPNTPEKTLPPSLPDAPIKRQCAIKKECPVACNAKTTETSGIDIETLFYGM